MKKDQDFITKTTLLTGCMFSGKTRRLVDELEKRVLAKQNVLYVHPKKDTRENKSHQSYVSKHLDELINNNLVKIIEVNSSSEIVLHLVNSMEANYSAIFIDEYFMINFSEIQTFLNTVNSMNIPDVYFAGLISDANCKLFAEAENVLPYIDDIIKTNAVCMGCGAPANYSHFIGNHFKKNDINVDNGSSYRCLCWKCYSKATGKN
ncbi:MAG: hypothetical protein HUJ68_13050 [Clostridia bacterium]|nr:hypothetical protein [Clostridia bacterium]